ncbi:hypothetical protein ACJ73_09649 [Blastomyces percursus]|uniref:Uncharacterized protein n=1 Tax=Blastomyces percursus TaxID=1658174 RepID=A0A1J9Q3Y1_9EURO|nr:hypothetical protein ACJ73_09649 [Blastomyces percursus]
MQFKFFSVLALVATCVVADEAVEKRNLQDQIGAIASNIQSQYNDIKTAIGSVPPNVASVLATAIPTPVDGNVQGYFKSVVSDVNDGTPPAWYTGLPEDARNFLSTKAAELASVLPTAAATAGESGNFAPVARPTGAMVGSLVGAAGVLGLAVML